MTNSQKHLFLTLYENLTEAQQQFFYNLVVEANVHDTLPEAILAACEKTKQDPEAWLELYSKCLVGGDK